MQILASNFIELYPSYLQMTNFMLVGFVVVLIALACLSFITSIVGFFFCQAEKLKSKAAATAAAAPAAAPAPTAPTLPKGGLDGAHLAVITAAVYSVLNGAKCRIVSISPSQNSSMWVESGRMSIFNSHNPKRK